MKRRILFSIIVLILFSESGFSQFSLNTEYRYLSHINSQNNKELIKDNIRNAELAIIPFLFEDTTQNQLASYFTIQLAYSYFLQKKYDIALWEIILKQNVYNEQKTTVFEKQLANECLKKLKLNQNIFEKIFNPAITPDLNKKNENAIKQALELDILSLYPRIMYHAKLLAQMEENNLALWLDNWLFLNQIKFPKRLQKEAIVFQKENGTFKDWFQISNKNKLKLLKKSFHYFIKIKSQTKAEFVLQMLSTYPSNITRIKKRWTKTYNKKFNINIK